MGNWQLEVFRMALYISFPIGVFHYFNQPENFEEYVIKVKETPRPRISKEDKELLKKAIQDAQENYQREQIEAMERQLKSKKMSQIH